MFSPTEYTSYIANAIAHFWSTRDKQQNNQLLREKSDAGNRGAVTGGKQMDGFVALLVQVALDLGVPRDCIYTRNNQIPGYFRPTKDWDFLIITPTKKLVAVVEFKSQVGSFGNNFNNRTEEVLGSALDFWTAFRENVYPNQIAPWLGYLLVVECCAKSLSTVRVAEPHFNAMSEFKNTSYLDRYAILCKRLLRERLYTSTALISSSGCGDYNGLEESISVNTFLSSFAGYISGVISEFNQYE